MTITEILQIIADVTSVLANKIAIGLGAILSFIFFITGGEDKMVECLSILMLIDYVTGVAKAFIIEKELDK